MTYREFNEKVLSFYRNRSHSSFCALTIDKFEMEQIADLDELKSFKELKKDWGDLLRKSGGIPQYFGLLAIQCYAAGQMHFDGTYTAAAYNVRFAQAIGLDEAYLSQLYSAKCDNSSVQEVIWQSAAAYFKTHFSQDLQIPTPTVMAGRYVQFPKSQALLNLEDLRRFTPFFKEEFRPQEVISFNYFQQRLEAAWLNINLTKRTENLFRDRTKYLPCLKQLFNYWSSWDGKLYDPVVAKSGSRQSGMSHSVEGDPLQLILILEDDSPAFYVKSLNDGQVAEVSSKKIFEIDNYDYFHKGMLLLNQSEYGYEEFVDSRMLEDGVNAWIILDLTLRSNEAKVLEGDSAVLKLSDHLVCYQWNSHQYALKKWFRHFFQEPNPIRLEGGIRINSRRVFLKGFGPTIISSTAFKTLCRNEVCSYDSLTAQPGIYKVRSDFFTDIEFEIMSFDNPTEIIESSANGWDWTDYEIREGGRWNGCKLNIPESTTNQSLARQWIRVNLGEPYEGSHLLLKNIANFKRK